MLHDHHSRSHVHESEALYEDGIEPTKANDIVFRKKDLGSKVSVKLPRGNQLTKTPEDVKG